MSERSSDADDSSHAAGGAPTPPPQVAIPTRHKVIGLILLLVIGGIIYSSLTDDSASGGSTDVGSTDADPVVERSCEIFYDISNDAASNVDTIDETRLRLRDLLDGYGVSLPSHMQDALRDSVAALTLGDTVALESAITRLDAACEAAL